MLFVRRPVDASDAGVDGNRVWRCEGKGSFVQSVASGGAVGGGHSLEIRESIRIGTGTERISRGIANLAACVRIQLGHLGRCQCGHATVSVLIKETSSLVRGSGNGL